MPDVDNLARLTTGSEHTMVGDGLEETAAHVFNYFKIPLAR